MIDATTTARSIDQDPAQRRRGGRHYSDFSRLPVRYFQEVIAGNVVKPGTNVFRLTGTSSPDDKWFAQISDAVLWIQVDV
jgi:hypothetical protein